MWRGSDPSFRKLEGKTSKFSPGPRRFFFPVTLLDPLEESAPSPMSWVKFSVTCIHSTMIIISSTENFNEDWSIPTLWWLLLSKIQFEKIHTNCCCPSKVTRRFGVAGMKAALDLFGYFGGPNRSPMLSVSAEARQIIKKAFIDNEFVPETQ